MESDTFCRNCDILRKELIDKNSEIGKLRNHIQELNNLLSTKAESQQNSVVSNIIDSNENSLSGGSLKTDCLNCVVNESDAVELKSDQEKIIDHITKDNITEKDSHVETNSKLNYDIDYVFDENYQMYYSLSTGYYYDEKRALMYEPHSCTYYKYNYDKKEYETVNCEDSAQKTEDLSNGMSDAVLNQVNNLNLNDDDAAKSADSKTKVSNSETSVHNAKSSKDESLNVGNNDTSEKTTALGASKDWQLAEGSNITITEMVKQIVEEHNNMSDFVYDESSKMYYSSSTGHYYDAVRNLLYDPVSGAYYFYDTEKQTYEFYWQTSVTTPDKEKNSKTGETQREEKLKSRRKYWKKKLDQINLCADTTICEKNNDENSDAEFSSPEDGEIFSSDDEPNTPVCIERSPVRGPTSPTNSEDICPPSIRAIVECSDSLKIGSLILITCSGGIIGRDKSNAVYIPDMCVSKVHAEIKYKSGLQQYSVEDIGSQNGTFINDLRLSEAKEKSEPHILNHGNRLSLGSFKLLLHMHVGHETCDGCEPGQVLAEISSQKGKNIVQTKEEKEKIRREEVRRLKKKYGLKGADFEKKVKPVSLKGYEDKAEIRRQTIGSDNPYEKTEEASMESCMPKTNKGYQMLERMGWKEGQTLGSNSDSGIHDPIPVCPWPSKAGLGSTNSTITTERSSDCKKMKKWVKAQERFFKLSLGEGST